MNEQILINAVELGKMLRLSRATVHRLHSTGRLPQALRFGRSVRWNRAEIQLWIASGAPPLETWERLSAELRAKRPDLLAGTVGGGGTCVRSAAVPGTAGGGR